MLRSAERAENREKSRLALADRLFLEGLYDESSKLKFCGEEFELVCTCCGVSRFISKSCKRRWCPDCAFIRGVELVEKYLAIVKKIRWPLLVTLTMPHSKGNDAVAQLNQLRDGLKKLRRQKWFSTPVKGGLGAIEIAGGDNGWHLHAHLLLECRWLSVITPEPRHDMSSRAIKACFKSAQREVANQWALCIGEDVGHVWIKRADKKSIYEALKYAVKPGTLESIDLPLRPVIERMKNRRFVSGWGTVKKFAAAVVLEEKEAKKKLACECGESDWITGHELDGHMRSFQRDLKAKIYREHSDKMKAAEAEKRKARSKKK